MESISTSLQSQYYDARATMGKGTSAFSVMALLHVALGRLDCRARCLKSLFDMLVEAGQYFRFNGNQERVYDALCCVLHRTRRLDDQLQHLKARLQRLHCAIPELCWDDVATYDQQLEYLDGDLKLILDEQQEMVAYKKDHADHFAQQQIIRMTEISIAESRSAISLTFLAFIFVPIILAFSIFGMNVQEINESGHSIWTFVLTSIVILLSSAFGWITWRAARNRASVRNQGVWPKRWFAGPRFLHQSSVSLWDFLAILLGLRVLPEARRVQSQY